MFVSGWFRIMVVRASQWVFDAYSDAPGPFQFPRHQGLMWTAPIVTRLCRIVRIILLLSLPCAARRHGAAVCHSPPPKTVYSWTRNVLLCCEITVVASLCTRDDGRVASRSRGPGLGSHANDTVPTPLLH